jgi:hypothetical protein
MAKARQIPIDSPVTIANFPGSSIFFLPHSLITNKKAEPPLVHPSAARASPFKRPAAFRPLLTEGLALSGESLLTVSISKKVEFGKRIIVLIFIQLCRHRFPPENKDGLFDSACDPKGSFFFDSLSEPVTKTEVFINQETSHLAFAPVF